MTCEACGRPDAETVYHGIALHEACAPAHWVKDAEKSATFMSRFHVWWAKAPQWKRNWDGTRPALEVVADAS